MMHGPPTTGNVTQAQASAMHAPPGNSHGRVLALTGIFWLLWVMGTIADVPLPATGARPLFITSDIARMTLLAAVPFALSIVVTCRRTIGSTSWLMAGACAALALLTFLRLPLSGPRFSTLWAPLLQPITSQELGYVTRPLWAAILLVPAGQLMVDVLPPSVLREVARAHWLTVCALLALLLPTVYVRARIEHDRVHWQELQDQGRLGEAWQIGQQLRRLQTRWEPSVTHLARQQTRLDIQLREIRRELATAPTSPATDEDRLLRAMRLAVLGDTTEALETLRQIAIPTPQALALVGTIHETRAEWLAALQAYTRARALWEQQTPPATASSTKDAGLNKSITGQAYCLRKLGDYPQAEQRYRELLEHTPSAATHFLLAQFYEDTQQTAAARYHATQARQLDARQFNEPVRRLLDKLATTHFGCLQSSSPSTH